MKNKATLIFSIILIVISLILIFIGAVNSIICLFTGIIILMIWNTNSYKWVCDECGETFEITLKQNIFGVNAGVNYKSLYCPKCYKKTMCKGVYKQ